MDYEHTQRATHYRARQRPSNPYGNPMGGIMTETQPTLFTLHCRKESYKTIDDLEPLQREIYFYIVDHPGVTDYEISQALNQPINTITGRRNRLASSANCLDRALIECYDTKINVDTGKPNAMWRVKELA